MVWAAASCACGPAGLRTRVVELASLKNPGELQLAGVFLFHGFNDCGDPVVGLVTKQAVAAFLARAVLLCVAVG